MEQCKECEQRKCAQVANTPNAPKEEDYPGTEPYPGTARAGALGGLGLGVGVLKSPLYDDPFADARFALRVRVNDLRSEANRLDALLQALPGRMTDLAETALFELVHKAIYG